MRKVRVAQRRGLLSQRGKRSVCPRVSPAKTEELALLRISFSIYRFHVISQSCHNVDHIPSDILGAFRSNFRLGDEVIESLAVKRTEKKVCPWTHLRGVCQSVSKLREIFRLHSHSLNVSKNSEL